MDIWVILALVLAAVAVGIAVWVASDAKVGPFKDKATA